MNVFRHALRAVPTPLVETVRVYYNRARFPKCTIDTPLIAPGVTLGEGCMLGPGVYVGRGVRIGAYSYANAGTYIDSGTIGRYCSIGCRVQIGAADHPSGGSRLRRVRMITATTPASRALGTTIIHPRHRQRRLDRQPRARPSGRPRRRWSRHRRRCGRSLLGAALRHRGWSPRASSSNAFQRRGRGLPPEAPMVGPRSRRPTPPSPTLRRRREVARADAPLRVSTGAPARCRPLGPHARVRVHGEGDLSNGSALPST